MKRLLVSLPTGDHLEGIVRTAVERDCTSAGQVSCSVTAYETALTKMRTVLEDPHLGETLWGQQRFATVVQALVVGTVSIAREPVLTGSDNPGFALSLIETTAGLNGLVFDSSSDFFFRLVFPLLTSDTDSALADLRAVLCDLLFPEDSASGVNLLRNSPRDDDVLAAFVAPPMSGITPEDLDHLREICAQVGTALEAAGIHTLYQPIEYADPDKFPATADDEEHTRRADIDNVLRSDLVIAISAHPAQGLASVLAWGERGGSAQLIFTTPATHTSPLPRSSQGIREVHDLDPATVGDIARAFVDRHFEGLAEHKEMRLHRSSELMPDLRRFREAFLGVGAEEMTQLLPAWFTVARLVEILRTIDHFAAATNEEIRTLERVLDLGIDTTGSAGVGLSGDDLRAARRFASDEALCDADLVRLLEAATDDLAVAGRMVSHQRRSLQYWRSLWSDTR